MKGPEREREVKLHNILFATDFSLASEAGFSYAVAIADRYHSDLYIAHVINSEILGLIAEESGPTILKQAHELSHQRMDRLLQGRHMQPDRFHPIIAEGDVAEVLVDLLRQNHIDLAVLGTHGRRAFKKLLLGSIAEEVFRTAPCPVLTVGPCATAAPTRVELRHILYPVEFAPDSSEAARYAVSLAERYAARLTVLNVAEDMPSSANKRQGITEPVERWMGEHVPDGSGLRGRVRFEGVFGSAAQAILDFATNAGVDLIVMSVRRIDPVISAHLPKQDTAFEVVSRATCPVLTVGEKRDS